MLILSEGDLKPSFKKRRYFEGSNRGNTIVNIVLPPVEQAWVETVPPPCA